MNLKQLSNNELNQLRRDTFSRKEEVSSSIIEIQVFNDQHQINDLLDESDYINSFYNEILQESLKRTEEVNKYKSLFN